MNNKTLSAVTLGAFVISLAVGLIIYAATDCGLIVILWTTLLLFGIALFALSFMYSGESRGFGPSESVYRMTMGIIAAVVGLIGMLYTFTDVGILILAAIFIIVLALVGVFVALTNGKKEGQ
ncbi:MAG: hypothetical protein LBB30_01360 [Candidatus Methanoplasma sp.]|jgi:hypothetical protein|nr:hypothetical protein [Candidatus Methanoplasma sp.]